MHGGRTWRDVDVQRTSNVRQPRNNLVADQRVDVRVLGGVGEHEWERRDLGCLHAHGQLQFPALLHQIQHPADLDLAVA